MVEGEDKEYDEIGEELCGEREGREFYVGAQRCGDVRDCEQGHAK